MTSKKTKHVFSENELSELSKKKKNWSNSNRINKRFDK